MIKILLVGPCTFRTKGGISTVIKDITSLSYKDDSLKFRHIASHVDGSMLNKLLTLFKALFNAVLKPDFDVIHIHSASDISFFRKSLFVILGKVLNKKIVMHVHGGDFDTFYYKCPFLIKLYIRSIFSGCDKIIVLSAYWKDFFQKTFSNKAIEVLHNGVNAGDFRTCHSTPENINKFLFMGRLTREKGIYDLLEAINRLVNQQNMRHLRFYIAGNGETKKVDRLVEQYGLKENVKLLGWIDEQGKLDWLNKVDTVLLPSYIEGLPMSIIEAMAAGKIVISTNVGGIPDLVTDQENGYLTEPGDVESLCNCIMHVISRPEEMQDISFNNIRKIEEQYDLPKIHSQLLGIYHELVNKEHAYARKEVKYKYQVTQAQD